MVGLDQSPVVLSIAQTKATNQQLELQLKLGDARTFSFPKKFDVIVCLFHVSSYLTTNRDLLAFFNSVSSHLEDTGIFIFDCWYGPGVLHSRPETQYKLHQHGHQKLHRIKVPVLNPDSNTVQVTHTIFAVDDRTQRVEPPFSETHNLRYFFFPEIELLLDQAGLEIVSWGNLLENFQPVKLGGWDAGFVVKRKNALAR